MLCCTPEIKLENKSVIYIFTNAVSMKKYLDNQLSDKPIKNIVPPGVIFILQAEKIGNRYIPKILTYDEIQLPISVEKFIESKFALAFAFNSVIKHLNTQFNNWYNNPFIFP
jgi:hypothetical protein